MLVLPTSQRLTNGKGKRLLKLWEQQKNEHSNQ